MNPFANFQLKSSGRGNNGTHGRDDEATQTFLPFQIFAKCSEATLDDCSKQGYDYCTSRVSRMPRLITCSQLCGVGRLAIKERQLADEAIRRRN